MGALEKTGARLTKKNQTEPQPCDSMTTNREDRTMDDTQEKLALETQREAERDCGAIAYDCRRFSCQVRAAWSALRKEVHNEDPGEYRAQLMQAQEDAKGLLAQVQTSDVSWLLGRLEKAKLGRPRSEHVVKAAAAIAELKALAEGSSN
jgi:hypothetical protein